MPTEGPQEGRNLAALKMLRSAYLSDMVVDFIDDLEQGKTVSWKRFYRALLWLQDFDKRRNWTRILQRCRKDEKKVIKGDEGTEIVVDMRPWKNRRIWQPLVQDILTDLNKILEGDVLSGTAFSTGPTLTEFGRPASGIQLFYDAKAKAKKRGG